MTDPLAPSRRAQPPRLTFTVSMVWFAAFFVLWSLALVGPTLLRVSREVPAGPELRAAAREEVRAAVRPRLPIAFGGALVTTALLLRAGALPGARISPLAPGRDRSSQR